MEARTLEALKASIAKWERNAEAETPESYSTHWSKCPLCLLFNGDSVRIGDRCRGCPVYEKTERRWCEGTPFEEATKAKGDWYFSSIKGAPVAHQAALAEVAFLKSLLPPEPTP